MGRVSLTVACLSALWAFAPSTALALAETEELTPAVPLTGDLFGSAVDVSGLTAVLGASGADAAYVFDFDGSNWSETQTLTGGAAGDAFGTSAAVSPDASVIVVGAHLADGNAAGSGAAYVFRKSGSTWSQEGPPLTASDGATGDLFGISAAVSGDVIVVGALGHNGAAGAAYIFRFNTGTWTQEQKLSGTTSNDVFGSSVSVSEDQTALLIGADGENSDTGAAYIFRFDSGISTWTQEDKLTDAMGNAGDQLGFSVSLSNTAALVGAPGGTAGGAAFVFRFDGNASWPLEQKLLASDAGSIDEFGFSVSASGVRAVVGAPAHSHGGSGSHAAYVFAFDGASWSEAAELLPSDGASATGFGTPVGVSGTRSLVGASLKNNGVLNAAGSVYAFVPEPSALALRLAGLAGLWCLHRVRRRRRL